MLQLLSRGSGARRGEAAGGQNVARAGRREEKGGYYQCLHLWRVAQDKMTDTPFINLHLPPLVLACVRLCLCGQMADKTLAEQRVESYTVRWVPTLLLVIDI